MYQMLDSRLIFCQFSINFNSMDDSFRVVVKVNRIGGGFGGKITRNAQVASACALVAKKLNRTCRFILPLQTNMTMCGKRIPCQCEYEVKITLQYFLDFLA